MTASSLPPSEELRRLVERWRTDTGAAMCLDGNSEKPCDGIQQCANELEAATADRTVSPVGFVSYRPSTQMFTIGGHHVNEEFAKRVVLDLLECLPPLAALSSLSGTPAAGFEVCAECGNLAMNRLPTCGTCGDGTKEQTNGDTEERSRATNRADHGSDQRAPEARSTAAGEPPLQPDLREGLPRPERVKRLARSFAQEWLRPNDPEHATAAMVDTLQTAMLAFYACASQLRPAASPPDEHRGYGGPFPGNPPRDVERGPQTEEPKP